MEKDIAEVFTPTLYELELLKVSAEGYTPGDCASESKWLDPLGNETFAIGVVAGVNDRGARLVPGLTLSLEQLADLARYYSEELYDIAFEWEAFQQTGSTEIRMLPFAKRRLAAIKRAMGPDHFARATEDVTRKWERFPHDSKVGRLKYTAEILKDDQLAVLCVVADRLEAWHVQHGALHVDCDREDFKVAFNEAVDRMLNEVALLMQGDEFQTEH